MEDDEAANRAALPLLRQTRGGKPIFGSAFGRELSVGRCLIFELCLDLWIALVSSHALKGKRVIQILGNQLHFGGCRPGLEAHLGWLPGRGAGLTGLGSRSRIWEIRAG